MIVSFGINAFTYLDELHIIHPATLDQHIKTETGR